MKAILFVLVVGGLGIAVGIGAATLRVGRPHLVAVVPDSRSEKAKVERVPAQENAKSPNLVVDAEEFDFGTALEKAEGSHDFLLTNNGSAPLKLTLGETSSNTLTSKLEKTELAPGESTKMTVAWSCKDTEQPFQQVANILTNAPAQKQVALTVSGLIKAALSLSPSAFVFRNISANEPSTATANLYCYIEPALSIAEQTMSNTAIAQNFEATLEPIAADALQAADPSAKSGLLVKLTLKPGLPPGPFIQQIVLKTNLPSTPTFGIPVFGTVASDINIAGKGFDSENNALNLGIVSGKDGAQVRLMLLVRGPYRKDVAFKSVTSTPSVLKVSLGEPTELNNGALIQTPLLIDIPPGSPSGNYLGVKAGQSGEIVLETTHPHVPKMKILVRFAVEN